MKRYLFLFPIILFILSGCGGGKSQKERFRLSAEQVRLDSLFVAANRYQKMINEEIPLNGKKNKSTWPADAIPIRNAMGRTIESFYGENDVTDAFPKELQKSANCVCAIIPKRFLKHVKNGYFVYGKYLKDSIFEEGLGFCSSERFLDEIHPCSGTGWAYKNNIIITAKHVIPNINKALNYYFVFGFVEKKSEMFIGEERVYEAIELLETGYDHLDFVEVQVNKIIPDSLIGKLSNATEIQQVYAIGHPVGLPLKYTPNGIVFHSNQEMLFTNLDAYSGNSGSPVFNNMNNLIEGILIRGSKDFEMSPKVNCMRSISYPLNRPDPDFFLGERVLRLSNKLK
jgi:hypothetical protein